MPAVPKAKEEQPRRRVVEPQWAYVLTTPGPDGHVHCASIDPDGGGHTAAAPDGHTHVVRGLDVEPAGGHTHELGIERCPGAHHRGWCIK